MHPSNFGAPALGMPSSGLASRRGGQNLKPLSFEALKSPGDNKENGISTPRTSRSHLLAGLRTAPKSATTATFPASPTTAGPAAQMRNRNSIAGNVYGYQENAYNGPKTSIPRYANVQQPQPQQQQQVPQGYNPALTSYNQQFTPEQILAPPEIHVDGQEQMDPDYLAQLVATNLQLAQQQQALQQQLAYLRQAQQQIHGVNLGQQLSYQNLYQQQQQQVRNIQSLMGNTMAAQPNIYTVYDPMTGQQTYYVDQNAQQQLNNQFVDQAQFNRGFQQQQGSGTPRLQVSPPPVETPQPIFRNTSPPRRYDSPIENPTPLPPPSANAFRRGHKKSSSLANVNAQLAQASQEPPKSAGPKTASFPLTPMAGGYGPGQARAGEHPIRQPRGPPSMEELKDKPTARHEGSKNFVTRTRRSAVHNLVRAGLERRKGSGPSSSGTISPISESAEEAATPLTDNESDSGHSGSGSLNGDDVECSLPSSRTSTGSWGAIGSDRPGSRQKARNSVGSASDGEAGNGSFASVFKNAGRTEAAQESQGQRRAPMLVLTSAEKRKMVA